MKNVLSRNQRIQINELSVDETIFSQANGVLGVRGTFCEGYGNDQDNPYALINGFYNLYPFHYEENSIHFPQDGQTIIKLPDATSISITVGETKIDLSHCELTHLERDYHMDLGLVTRKAEYTTPTGDKFVIDEERIVSQDVKGLLLIQLKVTSLNYTGDVRFSSCLTLPIVKQTKHNDPRVAQEKIHLNLINTKIIDEFAQIKVETNQSNLTLEVGINHNVKFEYKEIENGVVGDYIHSILPNQTIVIEKFAYYSAELTNPQHLDCVAVLKEFNTYESMRINQLTWANKFNQESYFDISDDVTDTALKYAMYQLNSSGGELDSIQIAAKGISGEGYEGHYFWDTEIYMLPYFILNQPHKAKRLLMYRYKHIENSRIEARHLGVSRGIKVPWRTINGQETSPYYPAGSAQIHINSDLAYSIVAYYNMTHDYGFMLEAGLELLIETAVFILDYGHYADGEFHLNTVTGPDEYTAIVNDNYYTNAMAKYHFENVVRFSKLWPNETMNLLAKCGYDKHLMDELTQALQAFKIIIKDDVIAQDAAFFQKKTLVLDDIPRDKHPMLLHYHPLYIYRHQVLKQADVVLALVLLNHPIDDTYRKSVQYYMDRTTHDSSLSKCIYGISAYALGNHKLANQFFHDTLFIDLNDERNHSKHGLHMANIGGAYLTLIYGIFGLRMTECLSLSPIKDVVFNSIKLNLNYLGSNLRLELNATSLMIEVDKAVTLCVYGEEMLIESSKLILIR